MGLLFVGGGKAEDVDNRCTTEIITEDNGGMAAGKKTIEPVLRYWRVDDRDPTLMREDLTWEEKALSILHLARCREFREYKHRDGLGVPTRFCPFNLAFFDLDKECLISISGLDFGATYVSRPPVHSIPEPCHYRLEDSVSVIAIKVTESDRGYPISVYGTVLARDEYDYRCVYLFRRDRDDPQLITSEDDSLALTGPLRALAATNCMYFEFHLKIKGDGAVDEDLSKGVVAHDYMWPRVEPLTRLLKSKLSTVEMVYMPVASAVEASISLNFLKGIPDCFIGHVTAWTTGHGDEYGFYLYDSDAVGTQTRLGDGGSVALNRLIAAVPLDEDLVIHACVFETENGDEPAECFEFVLGHEVEEEGHEVEERTSEQGPYELQVKVSFAAVNRQRRHGMWEEYGDVRVLHSD
ncbi:hypothetical protein ACP70R_002876 [Stipagrostis hirtigluma subsp. patula]